VDWGIPLNAPNKGDRLSFESLDDGAYIVRKASLRKSDGAALPYLKSRQRPLSDDSIREAIGKGALASYQRIQT